MRFQRSRRSVGPCSPASRTVVGWQPCLQPALLSAAAPGGTVLSFSYGFDQDPSPSVVKNNGNVVQVVNNRDTNRTQSFTYDELNRVATAQSQATSGTHCWGNSFGYDIWANLLSKTVTKCTAETLSVAVSTSNRITNAGFTYDAAGNMTNSGSGVMTYDAENRLVTAAGVTYTYDGDGKRVKKSNGKLYWTGVGSDPLYETDLAGNNQTEYIFFGGKRVARRDPSGAVFYYFSDHLGSASVVTNATGTIVEESDYYPFGGERIVTNSDPNQYKFTGKERDGESGLDYFIARHYSSNLGRFLQPDEFAGGPVDAFSSNDPLPDSPLPYADITNPQQLNKYTYTTNNPLRYTDPDGHDFKDFVLGAANAISSNVALGLGRQESYNGDHAAGQVVGDAISVVGGAIETAFGLGAAGTGVVACGTGVGCLAGAPAAAAGAALTAHGTATAGLGLVHLSQAAGDKPGEVYVTEPQPTSDKPYVGRTTQGVDKRMQTRSDGRTGKAQVVDKYKTKPEGRLKEQKQIDKRGGVKKLDNKRNEVDPKKMADLKKKVEKK